MEETVQISSFYQGSMHFCLGGRLKVAWFLDSSRLEVQRACSREAVLKADFFCPSSFFAHTARFSNCERKCARPSFDVVLWPSTCSTDSHSTRSLRVGARALFEFHRLSFFAVFKVPLRSNKRSKVSGAQGRSVGRFRKNQVFRAQTHNTDDAHSLWVDAPRIERRCWLMVCCLGKQAGWNSSASIPFVVQF